MTFNLSDITADQLNTFQGKGLYDDEVIFFIPEQWKKINTPLYIRGAEPINDPDAKYLQITFLRQQILPIKTELPIHVFYPLQHSETLNPQTYGLATSPLSKLRTRFPRLLFLYLPIM